MIYGQFDADILSFSTLPSTMEWNIQYHTVLLISAILSLSCRKSLNIASSCLVSPSCVLFVTGCMAIQFSTFLSWIVENQMLYNIIRKRITRGVQSLLKDHKYISFVQFYMLSNIYEKQDIFWVTERIKNLSLLVDVHNRYVSRCDAFINPNNESVVRILSTVVTLRPISFPYFLCCILSFYMAL